MESWQAMPQDAKPIRLQILRAERAELTERLRTAAHLMVFGPSVIATPPNASAASTSRDIAARDATPAKGSIIASAAPGPTRRDCADSAIASLFIKQGEGAISTIKAVHKLSLICGLTPGQSLAALITIGADHTAPDHDRGHSRLAAIGAMLKGNHEYAADLRAIVATETMLLIQNDRKERAAATWREGASADKAAGARSKTITMDAVILRTAIALYFDLNKALVRAARSAHDQSRDEAKAQEIARWLDDAAVGYCAILQKTESQVLGTRHDRPTVELVQNFPGETPSWAWGYVVALHQGRTDHDDGALAAGGANRRAGAAGNGAGNGAGGGGRTGESDPPKGRTLVVHTPPPRRDHALRNTVAKMLTGINGDAPDMVVAENLMAAAIGQMHGDGGGLMEAAEALDVLSVRAALVHVTETYHGPIVRIEPAVGRTLRQCRISMARLLAEHNAPFNADHSV